MRFRRLVPLWLALAALCVAGEGRTDEVAPWCAEGLETLAGDVCYADAPRDDGKRSLVIFLHGLTEANTGMQHALQEGMRREGKAHHFALLAPKGEPSVGPNRRSGEIAWPTAESTRALVEDAIVERIVHAQTLIEARQGAPFDEVFVVGFSNGAYYATSLALRGRLSVDGYAAIAGGSAALRPSVTGDKRKPFFVGVAGKDSTAKNGRALVKLLDETHWPHSSKEAPVGHEVSDSHLASAIRYLRAQKRGSKGP